MIKNYISTLFLILCLSVMAQDIESLSTIQRYKMAVANRHYSRQDFSKALPTYNKFYEKNILTAEHKNEYATMLITQGDIKEAASVLQGTQNQTGVKLLYNAYLYNNEYDKADSIFQLHPEVTNTSITQEETLEAYLQECLKNEAYEINNVSFNSQNMDFSPVVHDEKVYFASARGDVQFIRGKYDLTSGAYLDVYVVDEGEVEKANNGINEPYNDGPVAFSKNGNIVLVTRNNYTASNYGNQKKDYNALQIFKAVKDDSGEWGKFEELPFCSEDYSCNDPFIYNNELYFTSDMPGGFGGNDIYKIKITDDVTVVGEPENLGSDINTLEQEGFPYLDEKGTLYYASKGFIGFGGLDIYSATKKGSSYEVVNMGHKINSNLDDFSLFMEDKDNGYFASNRPGGIGSDDIYKFHIRPQLDYSVRVIDINTKKTLGDIAYHISDLPENKTYDVISDSTKTFDFVVFEELDKAQFDVPENNDYRAFNEALSDDDGLFTIALKPINIGVYGYVYNEITGEHYPTAAMRIYHKDTLWAVFSCDDAGDYMHKLEREDDYRIVALVDGYLPSEADISTRGKKEWIQQNLPVAKRLELEGILYDFDKSNITKVSAEILDNVVRLMNENPRLRIELSSHTDCRGSDLYNEGLADRRSKSAVKYLISHGIDKSRLEAKSYGEYRLKNKCDDGIKCSREEHHINRRTEIKIIE